MRLAAIAVLSAAAALGGAVTGQAAQAATVTLDQPCYSPGEMMLATGSGFTPGGQVSENLTLLEPGSSQPLGQLSGPVITADATGAFMRSLPAPNLQRGVDRREIALSVFSDQVDPVNRSSAVQWTLSRWEAEIAAWRSREGKARGFMVIDTYGWTSAASTLYAHYYYRNLKHVKTVRIGALTGPCRDLRKRVRQFPFRNVKRGMWRVYFTGTAVHDKRDDLSIYFNVRVLR